MPAQSNNASKVNLQLEQAIQAILADRPIAYHASLARALGSVTAGVLLSQFLYWQPRSQDGEGWFWKTQADIYDETGLTRTEQETARKALVRANVVEEKRRGVPARMHFRVDLGKVVGLLSEYQTRAQRAASPGGTATDLASENTTAVQFAGNPQSRLREPSQPVGRKAPNWIAENPPTITETTSETTSETTPETTKSNGFENNTTHKQENNFLSKKREISKFESQPEPTEEPRREGRVAPAPIGQVLADRYDKRSTEAISEALGRDSRGVSGQSGTESHPTPRRGRPPKATEQIAALVEQFSGEFHDEEHTKPNISQAARLWKQSRLSEDEFCQRLYEARARTKQAPGIEKRASGEAGKYGARNKMPYYFACLRDVLGMREASDSQPHTPSSPS